MVIQYLSLDAKLLFVINWYCVFQTQRKMETQAAQRKCSDVQHCPVTSVMKCSIINVLEQISSVAVSGWQQKTPRRSCSVMHYHE